MRKVCINKVILSPADRNCSGSQPCKKRDPEQKHLRITACVGFTLVELLVVVLIIGILSAIAIPMYQGAVDKSHWSTMLPASKAIKDAEEAFKMTNGEYSDTMEHLDVQMNNSDLTFDLQTPSNGIDADVIRVTNSKLGDTIRLASYLDDSPKFTGQLHCEARTGNERAERLCGKLLNGQELTSADSYTGYLLDQEIDKATCDNASRSWSSSKNTCYKTTSEKCQALGMPVIAGEDKCGSTTQRGGTIKTEGYCISAGFNKCQGLTLEQGATCIGNDHSCSGLTINGGTCIGNGYGDQCSNSTVNAGITDCSNGGASAGACRGNVYDNGSICVGGAGISCTSSSFRNGSICYANEYRQCNNDWNYASSYDETSCCCGICGNAPKCADRGITCDPQYMK